MLIGFEGGENAKATRLQALVRLSRAFGPLPKPTGNNARIAAPAPDLNGVPGWAKADLENLAKGGVLTASDLGLEENEPSTPASLNAGTVNRNELDRATVPAGETQGGGVTAMQALVNLRGNEIVQEIVNSNGTYPQGSDEQKIKSFYENILDTESRNRLGITLLKPYFDAIDAAASFKELNQANAEKEAEAIYKMFAEMSPYETLPPASLLLFNVTIAQRPR